ncbi:transmembrane protein, putative [Medicago truncatula]|uniref:Transmembrane protein, putative n=1 Tax=Medicago truncatula TaxID=3880 RepID=G7ITW0_MEDTR|nr:transmembrane protein, putative [Medicago truncatula]
MDKKQRDTKVNAMSLNFLSMSWCGSPICIFVSLYVCLIDEIRPSCSKLVLIKTGSEPP